MARTTASAFPRSPRGPFRRPGPGHWVIVAALSLTLVGCGASGGTAAERPAEESLGGLTVSPQNDDLVVGGNRVSLVLQQGPTTDVLGARATVEVVAAGAVQQRLSLGFVGADYPGLPVYVAEIGFAHAGEYLLVVHAVLASGKPDHGRAFIHVSQRSTELSVGQRMPPIRQPLAGGQAVGAVDSGVPPDPWHDVTVADALNRHQPLLVYVGEPGRCLTRACGDTITVLRRLCATYCGRVQFIHVEVHYPAGSDTYNLGYLAFHLTQEQPWVYLVTAAGVVSDRFEGRRS